MLVEWENSMENLSKLSYFPMHSQKPNERKSSSFYNRPQFYSSEAKILLQYTKRTCLQMSTF